jgi:hypothetical protein
VGRGPRELRRSLGAERRIIRSHRKAGAVERIDTSEFTEIAHVENTEQRVDEMAGLVAATRLATTHEMNGGVEQPALALESVSVATRPVVALDDQHFLPSLGEHCGGREPAHAAADDDHVVRLVPRLFTYSHRFFSRAGKRGQAPFPLGKGA